MSAQRVGAKVDQDHVFRTAAVVFAVAVALHGVDHLRRGMDIVPPAVLLAGLVQVVLSTATVVLVFSGSRWAPHSAMVVGFVSAIGSTAAHLRPTWSSWVTAIGEVLADIAVRTSL